MSDPELKPIEQYSPSTGKRRVSFDGGQTWLTIPPGGQYPPPLSERGPTTPLSAAPALPAALAAPATPAEPALPANPAPPASPRRSVNDIPDPAATAGVAAPRGTQAEPPTRTFLQSLLGRPAPSTIGRGVEAPMNTPKASSFTDAALASASDQATLGLDAKMAGFGAMLAGPQIPSDVDQRLEIPSGYDAMRDEFRATRAETMAGNDAGTLFGGLIGGSAPALAMSGGPAFIGRLATGGSGAANAARAVQYVQSPLLERMIQSTIAGGVGGGVLGLISGAGHTDVAEGDSAGDAVGQYTSNMLESGLHGIAVGGALAPAMELGFSLPKLGPRALGERAVRRGQDPRGNQMREGEVRDRRLMQEAGFKDMPVGTAGAEAGMLPSPTARAFEESAYQSKIPVTPRDLAANELAQEMARLQTTKTAKAIESFKIAMAEAEAARAEAVSTSPVKATAAEDVAGQQVTVSKRVPDVESQARAQDLRNQAESITMLDHPDAVEFSTASKAGLDLAAESESAARAAMDAAERIEADMAPISERLDALRQHATPAPGKSGKGTVAGAVAGKTKAMEAAENPMRSVALEQRQLGGQLSADAERALADAAAAEETAGQAARAGRLRDEADSLPTHTMTTEQQDLVMNHIPAISKWLRIPEYVTGPALRKQIQLVESGIKTFGKSGDSELTGALKRVLGSLEDLRATNFPEIDAVAKAASSRMATKEAVQGRLGVQPTADKLSHLPFGNDVTSIANALKRGDDYETRLAIEEALADQPALMERVRALVGLQALDRLKGSAVNLEGAVVSPYAARRGALAEGHRALRGLSNLGKPSVAPATAARVSEKRKKR